MGMHPSWLAVALDRGLIAETHATQRIEPPDLGCSEKEFQAAVVALAVGNGWKVFHPFDSRRSEPGWPDLTIVRGRALIFAELKTAKGKFTTEQMCWLDALACVPGIVVKRWRPADFADVVDTLGAK